MLVAVHLNRFSLGFNILKFLKNYSSKTSSRQPGWLHGMMAQLLGHGKEIGRKRSCSCSDALNVIVEDYRQKWIQHYNLTHLVKSVRVATRRK